MGATIYVFFLVFLILNMAYSVIPASVLNYRKAVNGYVFFNICHNESDNKIDWKFQDKILFYDGILVRSSLSESLHMLQNKSLYIRPISLLNIGKYECIKNGETLLTYSLDVEVPPTLSMTVDGHSYHDSGETLYIPYNKTIPVLCYAIGGRPAVNLSITVDNKEISPSYINTTTNAILNATTFDTRIMFALRTAEETGTLSCHSSGLSYYTEQRLEVSYSTYDESTTQPTISGYLPWIILSNAILLLCFLFICTYKITMKIRASSCVNLSTDADTTLGGTTQMQLNTLPADQPLLQNPLQGNLQNKQKLDLLSIPSDESNSIHSSGSESNYYSAADERGTKDRIFSESEFCILLTIKVGTIYNRWKGTIKMSRDVNKCAVLTTISEGVMKKKIINWNAFVKRTLDLPTTDRLTRIEGIAVDKTTLYLVTEHTVCETLDSRLTYDPSSHSSPFLVLDVMKHITAIVEGIECLQSYGFLHPGLSTKKVLYTKEGICKLYDFCLAEDASKIVAVKKTQMDTVSLNQFPPESFFRNEYTAESDVWSTAVVIWEILSRGEHPFPVDEDRKPGQDVKAPTLNWPQRYLQLRNLVLFDCWSQNCSLRPSIHHLKESFKAAPGTSSVKQPSTSASDLVVTTATIQGLSDQLSIGWKTVGRKLGIGKPKLEAIDTNYELVQEKVYQMLLKWERYKGKGATYGLLGEALQSAGRTDLQQYVYQQGCSTESEKT